MQAGLVKLADTLALGASARKGVKVRVLYPAPTVRNLAMAKVFRYSRRSVRRPTDSLGRRRSRTSDAMLAAAPGPTGAASCVIRPGSFNSRIARREGPVLRFQCASRNLGSTAGLSCLRLTLMFPTTYYHHVQI